MHSFPPVTVLMPCRDAAATVDQAVRSILRQRNVGALGLLAVDDGSRDGTLERLRWWATEDKRVIVLARAREGLVPALNAGLAEVSTPFVARQDADDVSHPLRLSLQLGRLAGKPRLTAVGCRIRGFPAVRVQGGMRRYEAWQNSLVTHDQMARELFVESPLAHASAVFRTAALEEIGGFRDFDGPEDWDLWARLLERGARLAKIARALYFWREHPVRATRCDPRLLPEKFLTTKIRYLLRGPLAGARKVELWSHGAQGQTWAEALDGAGEFAFAFRPLNPRPLMLGRAPLPPPPSPGTVVLVAYGTLKVRNWFRKTLAARGDREGREFWLVS